MDRSKMKAVDTITGMTEKFKPITMAAAATVQTLNSKMDKENYHSEFPGLHCYRNEAKTYIRKIHPRY